MEERTAAQGCVVERDSRETESIDGMCDSQRRRGKDECVLRVQKTGSQLQLHLPDKKLHNNVKSPPTVSPMSFPLSLWL